MEGWMLLTLMFSGTFTNLPLAMYWFWSPLFDHLFSIWNGVWAFFFPLRQCSIILREDTTWYDSLRQYRKWGSLLIFVLDLMSVQSGILGKIQHSCWTIRSVYQKEWILDFTDLLPVPWCLLTEDCQFGWSMSLVSALEQIMVLSRFSSSCTVKSFDWKAWKRKMGEGRFWKCNTFLLVLKAAMQGFTQKIVQMMKNERLFASQGGPIILSQVWIFGVHFA